MASLNHHIEEYLDSYLSMTATPEFAVLLKGKWGSGKSWFIRNYMETHKEYNFLYVSLYGVTATKEIEQRFFEKLHPILASKGAKVLGSVLRGLLKTTLHIDWNGDSKPDANISSQLPDIKLDEYLSNASKSVLIFDDLERCAIPINNVLGYINQFVEDQGQRIIIIANEEELIKQFNDEKKEAYVAAYLKIKEKLIGQSFDIRPDVNTAIDDFFNVIENNDCKKRLIQKKDFVIKILQESGHPSLRHLRQSIFSFERFWSYIPEEAFDKDELIEHIIQYFFSTSFEIKQGNIREDGVADSFNNFGQFFPDKTNRHRDRDKYSCFNVPYHPFNITLFQEFFQVGKTNKEKFHNSIRDSMYFENEDTPSWKKLWHFYYGIDDNDFLDLYEMVLKEFTECKIDNVLVLLHITGMFLFFKQKKLISLNEKYILKVAKKNLKLLRDRLSIEIYYEWEGPFVESGSFNLSYHSDGMPEFEKFKKEAFNIMKLGKRDKFPVIANSLLEKLDKEKSVKSFGENLTFSSSPSGKYYNIPLFNHMDVNRFSDIIFKLSNNEKRLLADIFKKRYRDINLVRDLKDEEDWVKQLHLIIIKKSKPLRGKVSGYMIENYFIPILKESIDYFERALYLPPPQ